MKFKVFLINLDKSTDRRELCEAELNKYGVEFERVAGVYGKDLAPAEIENVYSQTLNATRYKKTMGVGEVGCYLSHIKCWEKIVDEKLDYAVILEDDFKLDDTFTEFPEVFSKLQNWDYVRIAFPSRNTPIVDRVKVTEERDLVYYKKVPINTLAQVVSLEGAKKLLASSQTIFRPVDVDMKHYWEKNINVIGIDPPLIKDRYDFASEIDQTGNNNGRGKKVAVWKNLRYVVNCKLNRLWHSLTKPKLEQFLKP